MNYQNDFTYYFFDDNSNLVGLPSKEVPDKYFEDACTIQHAVSYVQKLGCCGMSQHVIRSTYHKTVLAVLKMAVDEYGEVFPTLYRGVRNDNYSDSDHLILFGSTDFSVAENYGKVVEYSNIKGLRTTSWAKSVVTDSYEESDEEVIFFVD